MQDAPKDDNASPHRQMEYMHDAKESREAPVHDQPAIMGADHHHATQVKTDTTPPVMMEHMHDMHESEMPTHDHHEMMVEDMKVRIIFSVLITIPILLLSPMIQMFLGLEWRFFGDSYLLFILSTALFIYGGKPFLTGSRDELKKRSPAMMTLIAFAITVAYLYSSLTIFVLKGNDFFWELATLIVIMLLGHWIEMKSISGASKALDELIKLMPENAHLINGNGETTDVPVKQLKAGDTVLVKPR